MFKVEQLTIGQLAPISFELAAGDCMVVRGPSGAGKTRLLRALADLDPVEGYIFLEGAERREVPGPEWRGLVRYSAAEPGWWAETPRTHFGADADVERLSASLRIERAVLDRPIAETSTGERQRLALIRALSGDPLVLLLDEPTAALDVDAAMLAEEMIRFFKDSGKIVLLITHDDGQAQRLANVVMAISGDRIEVSRL